jgi:hypothetical protein
MTIEIGSNLTRVLIDYQPLVIGLSAGLLAILSFAVAARSRR